MTHSKLIDGSLKQMGRTISPDEKSAIKDVMMAGEKFGFGNMIAWLDTAWAQSLREQGVECPNGMRDQAYPLPPKN
jgi:hypothetical protein